MSDLESKLKAYGLEVVCHTPRRIIVWNSAAREEFYQAEEVPQTRILAFCKLWCDEQRLTPQQYNGNEGRAQRGSINRLMGAFKTHKVRLYGYQRTLFGKATFMAVACDPQKKSDKGKPRILAAAASRIIDLEERLGERNE